MTTAAVKDLSDEDVIAYLKAKKDFFQQHPDLLEHLAAPGPDQGRRAVHGLLEVLDGRPAPAGVNLPCTLQVRETSGPATRLEPR